MPRLRAFGLALTLGALAPLSTLRAQTSIDSSATPSTLAAPATPAAPAALPALQRVRFELPTETVVGTVMTANRDSVLLQTAGPRDGSAVFAQRWIPLNCVSAAAVSVGHGSRVRTSLLYTIGGAISGAAFGALVAKAVHVSNRDQETAGGAGRVVEPARQEAARATLFGVSGAAVGMVIGLRNPRERWQRIPATSIYDGHPRAACATP